MVNAMLMNAHLPHNLWVEAILNACHILNRMPSKSMNVSLCKLHNNRKPNLNYFKVWVYISYYKVLDHKKN